MRMAVRRAPRSPGHDRPARSSRVAGRWRPAQSAAAVGFAIVWVVTAVAVAASATIARDTELALGQTLDLYADDVMHASRAQAAAEKMIGAVRGYLLTGEPDQLARAEETEDVLAKELAELEHESADALDLELLRQVQESARGYSSRLADALEASVGGAGRVSPVEGLRKALLPERENLGSKLASLVRHREQLQAVARRRAEDAATRSVQLTVGLGALALGLSAVVAGVFMSRLAETSRREREQTEKATRASAARSELLRIVAHDLRSPISAISLRAASMVRSAGHEAQTKSAIAIGAICDRMSQLIGSLLDAEGIEDGRLVVRANWFQAAEVVQDALETFEPAAQARAVLLVADVQPADLRVYADRGRLLQLLSNLIGNAMKFTPSGGGVTIKIRAEAQTVRYQVSDTGIGIPREELPRVFDRYWTSDASDLGGVGLGLYITKGIVEAHGGQIWVESKAGAGSCFTFELPAPIPARTSGEPRAAPLA